MSWNNKVIWSEGMFLRPQHFQQHDRYVETLVNNRCGVLRSYGWGLSALEIDQDMLALGKVALGAAAGVMPDGTPFQIPGDDDPPEALDIPQGTENAVVSLSLPVRRVNALDVAMEGVADGLARYRAVDHEVGDNTGTAQTDAPVKVGKLKLSLTLGDDPSGNYSRIALARISEARSDGRVILDEQFLPTCLDCRAADKLYGYLTELLGLLRHRGEALAGRVSQAGRGGVAEFGDYMLLQAVNRYEPLLAHMVEISGLHPEDFYRVGVQLAGELATFTRPERRPASLGVYDHADLQTTFEPLVADLRQSLSMVLEQNAVPLPLEERRYGVHVAAIPDRGLLASATFVLAVHADVTNEIVINQFPRQVKIGTVETIADLVNLQLPGIAVRPLPVAPRQIPFHSGFSYFELDKKGEYWSQLENSGGFAIHVGAEFPGIQMQLWAIRG